MNSRTSAARAARLAPWLALVTALAAGARAAADAPPLFAAHVALVANASEEPALTEVGFDSRRWTFVDAPPKRDVVAGDTTWTVHGLALLRDVDLGDGVIEFDVRSRTTPTVVFHAQSSAEFEEVYLRMGQSDTPVALQYVPVHRRFLPWRLYAENQAAATLDSLGRNHVRLEIRGRELRVFVNGATTPNLVATLRHPARSGAIGVLSSGGVDRFSHFRYAALPRAANVADADSVGPVRPGAITQWTLSPLLTETTIARRPPIGLAGWRPISADGEGRVNLSRYYSGVILEGQAVPVAARVVLRRDRAATERLAFGFCDRAVVYLNDRPIFSGSLPIKRNGDFVRMAMRDTLSLELRAGANELLVVTTGNTYDSDGGWGFAARLVRDGRTADGATGDAGVERGRTAPHTGT
jgi:hypothetical protein